MSLVRALSRRVLVTVCVVAALLGVPALFLSLHAYAVADRGPAAEGGAASARGEVVTLRPGLFHVRLWGEGYALGQRHGTLLRGEVQGMVRYLRHDIIRSTASRDLLLLRAWQLDAKAPARLRAEMRGVADGAEVDYADVLLLNTYDDLLHVMGCSSAVVLPEGGEPLRHARNLDYPIAELARHKVVFDLHTRGVQLRTVGFPGYVGVLTGMSSRGLGLSSHTSKAERSRVGTPSGLLYRQVLEEAQDLAGIKAALGRAARTIGNNLALSDARNGTALALEFDAEQLLSRPPEEGRLYVTNHFQLPAMQRHQDARIYSAQSGSTARIGCLRRSLPPGQRAGSKAMLRALSETGGGTGWRTPANPGTVQSVLMEPATGHLWIATGLELPVTRGGHIEVPAAWDAMR